MKLLRKAGSTSEIWQIFIRDSSSTTGGGLTGLTNASSGLTAYYHRDIDTTAVSISLVSMTVGTFTSSGFKEIDSTNMPGWYQFCPPNAALASGAKSCGFHLKGVTNMAPTTIEVDLQPDVNVTHIAGTAQTARDIGASVLLAAGSVQAIWDALTSALSTSGSIGKMLVDKLSGVSGQVASQSEVTSIQNNTRATISVPEMIERPDSGTVTYRVELCLYDDVGNMEAPDSAPTIALVNQSGTDRSSRLDSATMTLVSTGRYRVIYTADAADTLEQLNWTFSIVEGGATRVLTRQSLIVDTTSVDFTASDRSNLGAIKAKTDSLSFTVANQVDANVTNWKGSTAPAMTGDAFARLGAPAGASVSADIAALPTAAQNATELLDQAAGVETNRTVRQSLRLMLAALVGKLSGAATTTVAIRDTNDSKNRISATVDADGNRSSVTLDGT